MTESRDWRVLYMWMGKDRCFGQHACAQAHTTASVFENWAHIIQAITHSNDV